MNGTIAAAALVLLAIGTPPPPSQTACVCPRARVTSGWCRSCEVGYIAAVPVRSQAVHDLVHTHGHRATVDTMTCEGCKAAFATDGFCDRSGVGYVDGELYNSKLAYFVAAGEPLEAKEITCRRCREAIDEPRPHGRPSGVAEWCETCKVGRFGNLRYHDRETWELAAVEFDLLLRAIETSDRCEACATAMLTDGRCPECGISYKGGCAVEPPAPAEPPATQPGGQDGGSR